jgi:hypothetical protein
LFKLGGVLTDNHGNFKLGFSEVIKANNQEDDKAQALCMGMHICSNNHYDLHRIVIETDVETIINQIKSGSCSSFHIKSSWDSLQQCRVAKDFQHIFREETLLLMFLLSWTRGVDLFFLIGT